MKVLTNFKLVVFAALLLFFSCSKENESAITPIVNFPTVNIQDVSQVSSTITSVMRFYVYSNKAISNSISVDYSLISGTAISPSNYVAALGTVTIPAGQTQATIDVQINGDATDLRQPNLQFTVELSNPKSCTLGLSSAKGTIITQDGTYLPTDDTGYTTPTVYPGYSLVWSDEFSGTNLDLNNWNQEIGNGASGWGNNELEYYTNNLNNTFISDGNLIIEARKENINGYNYSSGRMTTKGKKEFKFGRIDIRAKLPVGKGIWPALWMLGSNISTVGWPACGEIDIMELIGTYPSRVTGTMHWETSTGNATHQGGNFNLSSNDFSQQFHVFSIIWEQDSIKWYVDNQLYATNTIDTVGTANYPFNAEEFFIFNVAVGGNWPGSPDDTTVFPQRMFVDYVRVFQ